MAKDNIFLKGIKEKYPEELLEKRMEIEGNVISCLWKDPLLLDEHSLEKTDFITRDSRFYFELAKNLHSKGLMTLDEVSILSNSSDQVIEKFQERGGFDVIEHMTDIIDLKNWDSYIDILNRENIILRLYREGFNLLTEIEYKDKKIIPIILFRRMTSEQVIDFYDTLLSSYSTGYSSAVLEDEMLDITDEFIKSCEEGESSGIGFGYAGQDIDGNDIPCFPFLSDQIGGYIPGTFNLLCGHSSTGKSSMAITIMLSMLSQNKKILIISNEQKAKVFRINFLVWLLYKRNHYYKVSKKKLMNGDLTAEDKKQIASVQEYWREQGYDEMVRFVSIADANMAIVKKKIRENVLRYGVDFVFYDTMKLDFANSQDKKEYLSLIQDSRDFDALAKKYDIIILCSLQLAINSLGKLFLDASMLSQSKAIKEVCETLIMMRTVYQEELQEDNKLYCNPFRLVKIGDKWQEEPYEPDPSAVWRAIFIDKSRSGSNSSDTGVGYLYKMLGSYCVFKESSQARFKHGQIQ